MSFSLWHQVSQLTDLNGPVLFNALSGSYTYQQRHSTLPGTCQDVKRVIITVPENTVLHTLISSAMPSCILRHLNNLVLFCKIVHNHNIAVFSRNSLLILGHFHCMPLFLVNGCRLLIRYILPAFNTPVKTIKSYLPPFVRRIGSQTIINCNTIGI